MPFPVTDRRAPVAAYPSLLTAGADETEADAAQRIASDPSVIDAECDPLYGDRVENPSIVSDRCAVCELPSGHDGPHSMTFFIPASPDWTGSPEQVAEWNRRVAEGTAVRFLSHDESERLRRLSRWQEQR